MPERNAVPAGPRPFWSGTLTFGLVSVPVRLFAAIRSAGPSLRMVDRDGTPLSRRYVCPAEDREVGRDELVRGYEVSEGEYVLLSEEELDALEPEKTREIDLRRFVPVEELDPVFFQRPYILTPADGSTKAYRLLAATMERTGRAGVATFVMRSKEYLVAILAQGGILRAETMRFHDEIRNPEAVGLPEADEEPGKAVSRLVSAIKKASRKRLDPNELEDPGVEELEALVARKRKKGEGVRKIPEVARDEEDGEADVVDLMAVLRRSLAQGDDEGANAERGNGSEGTSDAERRSGSDRGRNAARGNGSGGRGAADLDALTKSELYERAQELDVPGRSSMKKEELVEAIRRTARSP